jgi:endonuclease G, mitochondrial
VFFILQFPLADVRRFLDEPTGKLDLPNWPTPDFESFLRKFGRIRPRIRGGLRNWVQEERFCNATQALRFETNPHVMVADRAVPVRPYFRRFYADGKALAKLEIGLLVCSNPVLGERRSAEAFIQSLLRLPVSCAGETFHPLVECGARLAKLYQASTTETQYAPEPGPSWFITAGTPLLLLETGRQDANIRPFWQHSMPVPSVNAAVAHAWVPLTKGRSIRFWHVQEIENFANQNTRSFRIALMRLHAEREVLRWVLRRIQQEHIRPVPKSSASQRLQKYANEATAHILEYSREVSVSGVLAIANEVEDEVRPGEREGLRESLQSQIQIRPQIAEKCLDFHDSQKKRIPEAETKHLSQVVAQIAAQSAAGPAAYFRQLIERCQLPADWKSLCLESLVGDPEADAKGLVEWASARDLNPNQPELFVLGSLLLAVLADVSGDDRSFVVALLCRRGLIVDDALHQRLESAYLVPQPTRDRPHDHGPNFVWAGPDLAAPLQLQAFSFRQPDLIDVGFLRRGMLPAESICRVEIVDSNRFGTGFVVAPRLVMTCAHVVEGLPAGEIGERVTLRFGAFSLDDGGESNGRIVRPLGGESIALQSPQNELDFVALRTENMEYPPLQFALGDGEPKLGAALHILQHPGGESLKLAIDANGIEVFDRIQRRIQYHTPAKGGSSGAPCFDDDWRLVAVHQAERAVWYGSRRQGVWARPIYELLLHHQLLKVEQ